jgi:hypothetical protein
VAVFEQPASEMFVGYRFFVAAYSATEVLHALSAAATSDIFERMM